jgi:phenylacetic acid degradation operon negative regulatory protein
MLSQRDELLIFIDGIGEFLFTPRHAIWKYLSEVFSIANTRATLSRIQKDGYVKRISEKRGVLFQVSKKGEELLETLSIIVPEKEKRWDGKWRLVSFDIPEEEHKARRELRQELRKLGLGRMHRSVWISPHSVLGKVEELPAFQKYREYIWTFESYLKEDKRFRELVHKTWPQLDRVNKEYKRFIIKWEERIRKILKNKSLKEVAINNALKRLAQIEFRKILYSDPKLPQRFLPEDWRGEEARELLTTIEKVL